MIDIILENESIINFGFSLYILMALLFDINTIKGSIVKNFCYALFAISYALLTANVFMNGIIKGF